MSPIEHSHTSLESHYDYACKVGKEDWQKVLWGSYDRQKLRFLLLSLITSWKGDSVLDVGCGVGDFFGFIKKNQLDIDYEGIDFSEEMISRAKIKYPEASFAKKNIFDRSFNKQYDYTLASGTFNFLYKDHQNYIESGIQKMFDCSKKGIVFNLLSNYSLKKIEGLSYQNPKDIFDFCFKITPFVQIRHDYDLSDFTVYLYKKH